MMIAYIDTYKDRFEIEPICRVLDSHLPSGFITGRGYRLAKTRPASARSVRDSQLIEQLKINHAVHYGVYGVCKMWHAMDRAGWQIGRDQIPRLMRIAERSGACRGRTPLTTWPANKPDITYISARTGFVYTAFVTDVLPAVIEGWSTRSTMRTEALPLEASV